MKPIPLRLAPVLVAVAIPLLGFKLVAIAGGLAGQAVTPAAAAAPTPAPQAAAAPASPAAVSPAPVPAPVVSPPAAAPSPAASAASSPASGTTPPGPAKPAPAAATSGQTSDPTSFSPAEITLLQELSQRRAELDKRAAELEARETMLKATEQRIAEKIAALQKMEKNINDLLQKKDEENDAKIKSLVRIYEIMKPQDAARIFEQLDMPVLLEVVSHMSERKSSPILAAMQPQKAKALTLALAERRQAAKP